MSFLIWLGTGIAVLIIIICFLNWLYDQTF